MGLFGGGFFKKVFKAVAIATAAYLGGPAGGMAAASALLGKKPGKAPSPSAAPASPMAFLPAFSEMETRPQGTAQAAEGGDVASADLLGDTEDDEVKKRRAARTLLG